MRLTHSGNHIPCSGRFKTGRENGRAPVGPVLRAGKTHGVTAQAVLRRAPCGGSAAFLVSASDGLRYWCKVINNPLHPKVPVNEQLVSRLGRLLGAATCDSDLVMIPEALAGWEFRKGYHLKPGWAHGSVALDIIGETRSVPAFLSRGNPKRYAGFYALYDWLVGSNPHWLVGMNEERFCSSHDHGEYFPGGPGWTIESIESHGREPAELPFISGLLDPREVLRLARSLEAVTEATLQSIVASLPPEWPVTDDELRALLVFLLERRVAVAQRLRHIAAAFLSTAEVSASRRRILRSVRCGATIGTHNDEFGNSDP